MLYVCIRAGRAIQNSKRAALSKYFFFASRASGFSNFRSPYDANIFFNLEIDFSNERFASASDLITFLCFFWGGRSTCAEGVTDRSKEFVGLLLRLLASEQFHIDAEKAKINFPS